MWLPVSVNKGGVAAAHEVTKENAFTVGHASLKGDGNAFVTSNLDKNGVSGYVDAAKGTYINGGLKNSETNYNS